MTTPRPVSFVMAYYENAGMLARQIEALRELPPSWAENVELIVVDDASPNAPARIPPGQPFPFKVFRMLVDIPWNQDACRNLGMQKAGATWALVTDMDHVPMQSVWAHLLFKKLDPTKFYRFARVSAPDLTPYKPHPNSYALTKEAYWRVGGYDERWAGAYGTDGNFRRGLDAIGASEVFLADAKLVRYPREVIADASTTQYARQSEENEQLKRRIKNEIKDSGITGPVVGRFSWERVQ